MAQSNSYGDAQMLVQNKALPEGEMEVSLLDSFLKTIMKAHKPTSSESGKKPLFVDASFEKKKKSFIIQNRNQKLQPLTMNDIRKEINLLKREVIDLKKKVGKLETQTS